MEGDITTVNSEIVGELPDFHVLLLLLVSLYFLLWSPSPCWNSSFQFMSFWKIDPSPWLSALIYVSRGGGDREEEGMQFD